MGNCGVSQPHNLSAIAKRGEIARLTRRLWRVAVEAQVEIINLFHF